MAEAAVVALNACARPGIHEHAGARLVTPWAALIRAAIGLRLLVSLVGAGIMVLLPQPQQSYSLAALLLAPWRHFDALWFTQIAAQGYGSSPLTTAYMPLYPLLIRLAAIITGGHYLTAALIVSNLSLIVTIGLIWRWVAELFNPRIAWRTVALLLLFPDAFFLVGAYSESTFLALSAGCLLALRRERRLLAGTLALLATLTRLQGLVLIVPLLLSLRPYAGTLVRVYVKSRSQARFSATIHRSIRVCITGLAGAALPLLGFALYQRLLTTDLRGGDVFNTYSTQWHIPLQTPWQTIWDYVTVIRSPQWHLIDSPRYNYILLWYLLIALISLGVLLVSWRRLGWELTIFGVAGWC
ncbi:MAG TPA: glycosyltransferase family 39 protein, partial [Chloroflexota bacterium]|nr:glycosyltransferase family 39 protein [Chloroflexota bacterium]